MVDPLTAGSSLALTGFGIYLLNRYWVQRQERLRALALLQKYSTSSRIALHQGRMRLLVSMPQVDQLPNRNKQPGGNVMNGGTAITSNSIFSNRWLNTKSMRHLTTKSDGPS